MAEVRSVRYNTTGSRILSDRDISRPDLEIELNNQMASDFVKIEDHKKQIDAIQIALGARMRRSFIAGAIFGTLILVAIIMAGVGLQKVENSAEVCRQKTAYNTRKIYALERKFNEKLESLETKLDKNVKDIEDKLKQKVSNDQFNSKPITVTQLPSACQRACSNSGK